MTVVSAVTAWSGLAIDEVEITGQSETSEVDVLDAPRHRRLSRRSSPSMSTPPARASRRCPGSSEATIRKLYPDTLADRDHRAQALRHLAARRRALAHRSQTARSSPTRSATATPTLPLRRRRRAPTKRAGEFVALIDGVPVARSRRSQAGVLVSERRWNVVLDNGVELMLPEDDPGGGAGPGRRARRRTRRPLARDRRDRPPPARPAGRPPDAKRARTPAPALLKERDKAAQEGDEQPDEAVRPLRTGAPAAARRPAIVSVLDVGSSKICCLIARLTPRDAEARRCAAAPTRSRCSASATSARAASSPASSPISTPPSRRSGSPSTPPSAWPGVTVDSLIVNVSCRAARRARPIRPASTLAGKAVERSRHRPRARRRPPAFGQPTGRSVIHALPIGYSLDADGGIADPRGMVGAAPRRRHARGHRRRAAARAISSSASTAAICRSRRMVATPYASGLVGAGRRRGRTRLRLSSISAAARPRSRSSPTASSSMSTPSPSAASTSPPTSPAASRPASRTPSG